MNKLNKFGMEVIAYKEELLKEQPAVIFKSLNFSVDSMLENKLIDVDVHYTLKEKSVALEELREVLLEKKPYKKTNEELFEEFEVIREHLNEKVGFLEDCETISVVEKDKIVLSQNFVIKEDFIKDYFLIESENDYENLMGRKKFLHKFALLRLEKIMKDFLKQSLVLNKININYSPVFFNEVQNLYGIQLIYNMDIVSLEDENTLQSISEELIKIVREAKEYYNGKMVA